LNLPASNSSARRPIGPGFALFCLADRRNEMVATWPENSNPPLSKMRIIHYVKLGGVGLATRKFWGVCHG
jgi:hypothetical protein